MAIDNVRTQVSDAIAERRQPHHPQRPLRRRGERADPRAAHHRGGAPPSRPREDAARASALIVETGEAREVHHFALLLGYGAGGDQPVPRVRHDPRPDARERADRAHRAQGDQELREGGGQGHPQGDVEDGHLDRRVVHRRADLRGGRPVEGARRRVLHRHRVAHRGHRPRRDRRARSRRVTTSRTPIVPEELAHRELPVGGEYQWRREGEYHLFNPDTVFKLQHSTRSGRYDIFKQYSKLVDDQATRLATLRGLFELKTGERHAGADRRGRAGFGDRQAVLDGRDELRLDQQGSAREPRDRDEPARRALEHRRGRRGPRPVRPRRERRPAAQRDQAGRVGALRRDERVPRQRRRPADQDGAGRQAGRGRRAPGPQGVPVDREDAALDAGRRPDLAAAAPRHLLDRGSQAAHPRPEEREQPGARAREAGRRGRRRHGRGGRVEGARRRRAHQRARRRHGRGAAHVDQARGRAVGARAWPRRSRRCC